MLHILYMSKDLIAIQFWTFWKVWKV